MSILGKIKKPAVLLLFSFFTFINLSLVYFDLAFASESLTKASQSQFLGELEIGDRVVDNSWVWEFRTGYSYSYQEGDIRKPVTWIVVAKDHYTVEGDVSHLTLLSKDLIGFYAFDDSAHIHNNGSNHWGESGAHGTATKGLRPWLNSTGNHFYEGFYNAFSDTFKSYILITKVPNKEREDGNHYTTKDSVFIPSSTEIGDINPNLLFTYEIGDAFPYFKETSNAVKAARFPNGKQASFWTRSPGKTYPYYLVHVSSGGGFLSSGLGTTARHDNSAVRPIVNLSSDLKVSLTPNADGDYVIKGKTSKDSSIKIIKWEINSNWEGFKLINLLNYLKNLAGYVIDSNIEVYVNGDFCPPYITAELSSNESIILSKVDEGHYSKRFSRDIVCFNKLIHNILQAGISLFGGFYHNTDPPVPPEITINRFIINNESFTISETRQELPEIFPVYKVLGTPKDQY